MGLLKAIWDIFFGKDDDEEEKEQTYYDWRKEQDKLEKEQQEEERIDKLNNDIEEELNDIEKDLFSYEGTGHTLRYKSNCYDYCKSCLESRIKSLTYWEPSNSDANLHFLYKVSNGEEVYQENKSRAEGLISRIEYLIERDSEED